MVVTRGMTRFITDSVKQIGGDCHRDHTGDEMIDAVVMEEL